LNGLMSVDKNDSSVANPNLISNPGFTGTSSWTFYANSAANASGTFATEAGMGKVSISDGGIATTDLQLYQPGLYLIPGQTYSVSFKAKSSAIRTITASIQLYNNPWTGYWTKTIDLDTSTQTFGEYSFVYYGSLSDELRINFYCGGNTNAVWIDDIDLHAETGTMSEKASRMLPAACVVTAAPNPFNYSVTITLSGVPGNLLPIVQVYDLAGRQINTLLLRRKSSNGFSAQWNTEGNPSGVYLIKTKAGNKTMLKKIFLVR
jgi:hypothetical protein